MPGYVDFGHLQAQEVYVIAEEASEICVSLDTNQSTHRNSLKYARLGGPSDGLSCEHFSTPNVVLSPKKPKTSNQRLALDICTYDPRSKWICQSQDDKIPATDQI